MRRLGTVWGVAAILAAGATALGCGLIVGLPSDKTLGPPPGETPPDTADAGASDSDSGGVVNGGDGAMPFLGDVDSAADAAKDAVTGDGPGGNGDPLAPGLIELSSGQGRPSDLAVSSGGVFWLNAGDSSVRAAPKTPGNTRVVTSDAAVSALSGLVAAGGYLFFGGVMTVGCNGFTQFDTQLVWMVKEDGTERRFWDGTNCNGAQLTSVGLGDGLILMPRTKSGWNLNPPATPTIEYLTPPGTTLTTLAPLQDHEPPSALTAAAGYAFWSSPANRIIYRHDPGSGATANLATGEFNVRHMRADGTTLYWLRGGGDVVAKELRAAETDPVRTLATGQSSPRRLALTNTHVYWTNSGDGTVWRVAKTGGQPERIADGMTEAYGIATDAQAVYFTDAGQGRVIMRRFGQ